MQPSALKTAGGHWRHDRGLINFQTMVQLGMYVPIVSDHKFLSAFKRLTTTGFTAGFAQIEFNETIAGEIVDKFIYDFDENYVSNCFVGPSSSGIYKGLHDIRPAKAFTPNQLDISKDLLTNSNMMKIDLAAGDSFFVAKLPEEMVETSIQPNYQPNYLLPGQQITNFTVWKPRLMNVYDHTLSLIGNLNTEDTYLCFPMTAQGTISSTLIYRFSFYYRVKGNVQITPVVQQFSNTGALLQERQRETITATGATSNSSDYEFYDLLIPDVANQELINENTKRMRVYLYLNATEDSVIEIAYPSLEHSFNSSSVVATVFPENPSSMGFKDQHSASLMKSPVGTISSFDSTKMFPDHVGRKKYNLNLSYSLMDSTIVNAIRILENYNVRGDDVILRPQHHDLPPMLLGDISVTNTNTMFDYHYNDVVIDFKETI